jgi:hypothetical protein
MRHLLAVVAVSALFGSRMQAQIHLPDPASGNIGGKQAVLFWPTDSVTQKHLPVEGCVVHVVGENGEITHPCGTWFNPEIGRYSVWLETRDRISPGRVSVAYGGGPFPGYGKQIFAPVVPAGNVLVSFQGPVPAHATFRALALKADGFPFERQIPASAKEVTLKVPAGPVLVGLFDRDSEAVALSQPVEVVSNRTMAVRLSPSRSATALVVLDRPPKKAEAGRNATALALAIHDDVRPPDVFLDAPGRLFAIWYDLPPGKAELSLRSTELMLNAPTLLVLKTGNVATYRDCTASR